MWADVIPVLYTQKFNEMLPSNWLMKADSFTRVDVTKIGEKKAIITPSVGPRLEDTVSYCLHSLQSTKENGIIRTVKYSY